METIKETLTNLLPPTEINITYLLGAGASATAIPIVSEMPKAIEDLWEQIDRLNNYDERSESKIIQTETYPLEIEEVITYVRREKPISTEINIILEDIDWLHELAS